ncbi:MAG: ribosome silencing factor [Candidatus Shikimatogenerans bostrichidophilus]|nr:MAG: ribosome silencing factor [Candidatus Shikimatogenerans bostrichidophilus]
MKIKIKKKRFFFIKTVIKIIKIINGLNIKIIYTNKNNLFDYFIICEGTSYLHLKSIYQKIELYLYNIFNIKPLNIEGIKNNKWILIDYNFIIINIFLKKIRYYYNIDNFFRKFPKLCLNCFLFFFKKKKKKKKKN